MGWWFLLAWLEMGIPQTAMVYAGQDEQRCLTVADEHLERQQERPDRFVEVVYLGCVRGSQPRMVR